MVVRAGGGFAEAEGGLDGKGDAVESVGVFAVEGAAEGEGLLG